MNLRSKPTQPTQNLRKPTQRPNLRNLLTPLYIGGEWVGCGGGSEVGRFKLEPYTTPASRHTCPSCKSRRDFVRYIDTEGEIEFPEYVGRCNRADQCGHHIPPRDYFAQNGMNPERPSWERMTQAQRNEYNEGAAMLARGYRTIDEAIVKRTLTAYQSNVLACSLAEIFGWERTQRAFELYKVGTLKSGGCLYWLHDIQNKALNGKLMDYQGLKRSGVPRWVERTTDGTTQRPTGYICNSLFGAHLLKRFYKATVVVVESEKSALIASMVYPMDEMLFVAAGGSSFTDRLGSLKGRRVIVMPDCSPWELMAPNATRPTKGPRQKFADGLQALRDMGCTAEMMDLHPEWGLTSDCPHNGWDIGDEILSDPAKWIAAAEMHEEPIPTYVPVQDPLKSSNTVSAFEAEAQRPQNTLTILLPLDSDECPF